MLGVTTPLGLTPLVLLHADAYEEAVLGVPYLAGGRLSVDYGIYNLFGSALIVSGDGALIFGVMGADTANAGRVYPPGGSPRTR